MISLATETKSELQKPAAAMRHAGEVVYIYAFDVAYEMSRLPVRELLGQPVTQFEIGASRRNPRQLFFCRPQMVRLPPVDRTGPFGPVRVERIIKLLTVGAISITVRVPFDDCAIEQLVEWHDLEFKEGSLHEEAKKLAEQARAELAPFCIRPVPCLEEEEAYTVFCIESPLLAPDGKTFRTEDWLRARRRAIAGLLTQESHIERLSLQEAEESTSRYLSYYDTDLAVIDWDAALVIDKPGQFDQALYAMELANLQLAELEAYDRILDEALDRSYRDLSQQAVRHRQVVMRELREIRIDLARLNDELLNITKFFGDWHLARVYELIATRFHLADWHGAIDEKLKTLNNLYQLLQQDQNNRWMLIMELTIVLLFIVDLVLLVWRP